MQLLQALKAHEAELEGMPKTVNTLEEAVQALQDGLGEVADLTRAATGPHTAVLLWYSSMSQKVVAQRQVTHPQHVECSLFNPQT